MREAFFQTLTKEAHSNKDIFLLLGDLGFGASDEFRKTHPKKFLNTGVAEQNMTALAAGMAFMGKVAITYSIGNFNTLRCLEQIRNDVCYHKLNVKIVSVGGGVAYGAVGATHHATEDLAIMRSIPNLTVVAPNDPIEAMLMTKEIIRHPGPVYLRLGRSGEPPIHQQIPSLPLGKIIQLRKGHDVACFCTGGMLKTGLLAAEVLERVGLSVSVFSVSTIKPLDGECIEDSARSHRFMVSLEDHSICGGLGGAIAEILAEMKGAPRLLRLGFPGEFTKVVGNQEYIHDFYGLTSNGVFEKIRKFCLE